MIAVYFFEFCQKWMSAETQKQTLIHFNRIPIAMLYWLEEFNWILPLSHEILPERIRSKHSLLKSRSAIIVVINTAKSFTLSIFI